MKHPNARQVLSSIEIRVAKEVARLRRAQGPRVVVHPDHFVEGGQGGLGAIFYGRTVLAALCLFTLFCPTTADAGLVGLRSSKPAELYDISAETGATLRATVTDAAGAPAGAAFTGLEYYNGLLYATNIFDASPWAFGVIDPQTVDPQTKTVAFSVINRQAGMFGFGLAIDPSNGLFYSIDIGNGNTLVSVTPSGAVADIIGTVTDATGTVINVAGMAFVNGTLYATSNSGGPISLYTVNTSPGGARATLVGAIVDVVSRQPVSGQDSLVGLAFHPTANALYMTTTHDLASPNGGKLYVLDIGTGVATFVKEIPGGIDGLAFVPDPVTAPVLGCTGFADPFKQTISLKQRVNRAIPLRVVITDADNNRVTDLSIPDGAAPVVDVSHSAGTNVPAVDITVELVEEDAATSGNAFAYDPTTQEWALNLKTKDRTSSGTYTVTVKAGSAAYQLSPTCIGTFIRQAN
jgi:hypothetical protein